ncbi:MAG: VOC family protein [Myxococcota bacterium]
MPLPNETPPLQPYLTVTDAAKAIELYSTVFGMKERYRLAMPDGRVGHAELERDGLRLLLADEFPEADIKGPTTRGGTTVNLLLYVEDVDQVVEAALAAGFTQQGETQDMFHGDRAAKLVDPFGHRWLLNQRLEDVSIEDIKARFAAMFE